MLRAVASTSRRLPTSLTSASRLAPASALLRRAAAPPTFADHREGPISRRELSSKAALTRMGGLSVDPLAANTTVQGVEYVLTGFDKLVNWARKSSMWPMTFGLA